MSKGLLGDKEQRSNVATASALLLTANGGDHLLGRSRITITGNNRSARAGSNRTGA
jgi:hypothetical protein